MSEKAYDYKKEYKDLYMPKSKPMLIDVPGMNFIMVDGKGDPNNNTDFQQVVELLYGLSYAIKMSKIKGAQLVGYFEYIVPPLEGLWWIKEGCYSWEQRDNWEWTLMIRQPEFVTTDILSWACNQVKMKKPGSPIERARLETYVEGLSVQMMHVGPYATEHETVVQIENFIKVEGLRDRVGNGGKHHEIYLSDPRKCKPEKMKTVLRHPVEIVEMI